MKSLKEKPMHEIERAKGKKSRRPEEPCQLYLDAVKAIENAPSANITIARLTRELEALAAGCKQTVKALLQNLVQDWNSKKNILRPSRSLVASPS
jgi:hypothetical protein